MQYVFAMTNTVEGFNDLINIAEWMYYTSKLTCLIVEL